MTHEGRCAIAVMAKAPRPGRVKTRLVPPLSPDQAMAMSGAFLRDITENIALAGRSVPIDGWIAYAPAGDAPLFGDLLAENTRMMLADGSGPMPGGVQGLGACLLQTVRELFARGYRGVCVLNADSPTLPTAFLVRMAEALLAPGERAVLGPAEDGGYYALGMQRPRARLFAEIAWSTDRVAEQTRARAAELGLTLIELPPWYDVDDAASLQRLIGDIAAVPSGEASPFAAPATTSWISQFDRSPQNAMVG